jgi:hypothetical protein
VVIGHQDLTLQEEQAIRGPSLILHVAGDVAAKGETIRLEIDRSGQASVELDAPGDLDAQGRSRRLDYAWRLFGLIDHDHPGVYAMLTGKTQQVFGGATTTAPVNGRHRLGLALETGLPISLSAIALGVMRPASTGGCRSRRLSPFAQNMVSPCRREPSASRRNHPVHPLPHGAEALKDVGFVPMPLP